MVESGDYRVPRFNGELRPDKPVLSYWLMSASLRVLGTTELAVRFWSPLATAVACFGTFLIGRLLFSARAGLWAMTILATTPMMFADGTAALADALLLAFTVLATLAFVMSLVRGPRPAHWLLLTFALAGAQLTKGPVGLLPLLTIGATAWFGRRQVPLRGGYALAAATAAAASLALFLAWFVPADRATAGELFRRGFHTHLVERSLQPLEGHGATDPLRYGAYLLYYPAVVVVGFFPWTLHLGGALSALGGRRVTGVLLWSWILPPVALMTLVATKVPHYVLSIWPALALAVAGALDAARSGHLTRRDERWMRFGAWLHGGWVLACSALLIGGPRLAGRGADLAAGAVAAAILVIGAVVAIRAQMTRRYEASARAAALVAGAFLVWTAAVIVPRLDALKPVPPLARAVRERIEALPGGAPVAAFDYAEPTLHFYVGQAIGSLHDGPEVLRWAAEDGPGMLILTAGALARLEREHGPLGLERLAASRGFDFVKGRSVELVALERPARPVAP
jgi:4-amino-4-deoxy-L-arabinose transferase-like glycosyltransferase